MPRKKIPAAYKEEAAKLVLEQNYTVAQACEMLGVGETALRRWINQFKTEHGGETPSSEAITPAQRRIQQLEKRVTELERERDILKKSTAFFVKELDRFSK